MMIRPVSDMMREIPPALISLDSTEYIRAWVAA
jgi:hypothetical protein